MEKSSRKFLLSITLFLSLLCFGMGLNLGLSPVAKAEGTLSIASIRQINLQQGTSVGNAVTKAVLPDAANNNSASAWAWGSLYVVKFDTTENLFPLANNGDLLATASGGTVTAVNTNYDLTSIFNSISVGRKNASFASLAGGSAIYKYADNAIALKSNRVIGWTCFKFAADMSIAGYTIDSAQTWWENQDWSFTKSDTEQEFMINNVWVVSTANGYATINIAHNRAFTVDKSLRFAHIYINGQQIVDENDKLLVNFVQPYSTGANWGNEYDAGANGGAFKIYISNDLISNKELTITFKQGFKLNASQTDSLAADQTFKLGKDYYNYVNQGASGDFSSMWNLADMPIFVNADKLVNATEVNYVDGCANSTAATGTFSAYTVKFDKNILEGFEDGSDITTYMTDNTNFMRKVLINSMPLYLINNGTVAGSALGQRGGAKVTLYKVADDTIKIHVKNIIFYADVTVLAGLRIGEYANAYDVKFYQDNSVSDKASTFSKLDQAPEFKVFDIYTIAYGSVAASQTALIKVVFNSNPWIKQDANFDENVNDFSNGVTTNADINKYLLANNDEQVYHGSGTSTTVSAASEIFYGYTQLNVTIKLDLLDGDPTLLKIAKGWTVCYETIDEDQYFIADSNNYNQFWGGGKLPIFTEIVNQEVTYKQGETTLDTTTTKIVELPDPTTLANYNAEKLFIGWTDGTNLYKAGDKVILTDTASYSVVELDAKTVGAELKIWGATSGVRFLTQISLAEWSAINPEFLGEYGTLVARADDLGENALTIEAADADSKVKKIVSSDCMVEEGIVEVRGGVENIPSLNYTKTLVSCAYLTVNYTTGVGYVYTDVIERSIATVAQELLDSEYEFEADQIAWLNTYAGIEG